MLLLKRHRTPGTAASVRAQSAGWRRKLTLKSRLRPELSKSQLLSRSLSFPTCTMGMTTAPPLRRGSKAQAWTCEGPMQKFPLYHHCSLGKTVHPPAHWAQNLSRAVPRGQPRQEAGGRLNKTACQPRPLHPPPPTPGPLPLASKVESLRLASFWNVPSCSVANTHCPSPSSVESPEAAEAGGGLGCLPVVTHRRPRPLHAPPAHCQQRHAPPAPAGRTRGSLCAPSQTQIF